MERREQLEKAIKIQESLRGTVDDAILDETIATLREKLAALEPPPQQQRKQATILFMDIAGHTALTVELDPEEQMEVVDAIIARLAGKIDEHGGHVARYQGDGFKAVFGLPVARENDPAQAIRAGLGIQVEAEQIAGELEGQRGMSGFRVRVGIATGLVFSGGETEGEDTIKGQAVNLAARLESAAEPGTILIAHDTYKHVRGVFDFQPLEPIEAKGFSKPVEVYRVLREKVRPFYRGMRGVEGVETRMVGRELEFQQLQKHFYEVIEESEGQIVTVVGEAGLGKSRLLYEFENWVDLQPEDVYLYKGRARLETMNLPYGLLRDLFAFRFEIQDDDQAKVVREKLVNGFTEGFGGGEEAEKKTHIISQLLGYDFRDSPHLARILEDPQQLRDRALKDLGEYFKALSGRNPVLVLLEDLHWGDEASLDAINHLSWEFKGQTVFILATTRHGLIESRPHWGEGQDFHQRITFKPLSKRESRRLVAEVLQRVQEVPDELQELVVSNAEGNPFYVEELVKMLIEDGVIVPGEAEWRVETARLAEVHVPPTLTGVLQARLDGLPADERRTLQGASVVGRVFWDRVLEHIDASVEDGISERAMAEVLDNLRSRELIFRRETSAFEDAREHIFKHALLREVTYESVLKRVRQSYHELVAEWLIEHVGERAVEVTGLIANHLVKAGKESEALVYLRKAGEEAAEKYANEEATGYLNQALALVPEFDTVSRFELLLMREKVYEIQGKRDAQAHDLATLESISEKLGDKSKQAEVILRRANYAEDTSNYQASIIAAQRVVELAHEIENPGLEAKGYLAWGTALWRQDTYEEARSQVNQALALAKRTGLWLLEGHALRRLGQIAVERGEYSKADSYYRECREIYRKVGDRKWVGAVMSDLGEYNKNRGDYSAALYYYKETLSIAREIGYTLFEGAALSNVGWVSTSLGKYQESRDYLKQALIIFRQLNNTNFESNALLNLGYIAFIRGDYRGAREHIESALAIKSAIGDRIGEVYALWGLGETMAGLEEWESAKTLFKSAVELSEKVAVPHIEMEMRAGLARVGVGQGVLENAQKQVDIILEFLEAGNSLDGTEEPMRVYLTCCQVLRANQDPRAEDILRMAYNLLQEGATKISEEGMRWSFLENVPWHREIVKLWENREITSKPLKT